jgi:hypothetical protein
MVVCSTALVGGVASAASRVNVVRTHTASPDTWTPAIPYPGTITPIYEGSSFTSVSCPSKGNCAIGGSMAKGSFVYGIVGNEVNGSWQPAVIPTGLAALSNTGLSQVNAVSCASAGNCAAVGVYQSSATNQAFVVNEVSGVWQTAIKIPGVGVLNAGADAQAMAVSCPSAGNCSASGYYRQASHEKQAFVVNESSGVWGTAVKVPNITTLNVYPSAASGDFISCGSAGNCTVGGYYGYTYGGGEDAFLASESGGTWSNAFEVAGTAPVDSTGSSQVNSISCTGTGECVAGGVMNDVSGDQSAFIATQAGGVWGSAVIVNGTAALNAGGVGNDEAVSCSSTGNCSTGGYYTTAGYDQRAFVATETSGTWGAAVEVPGIETLDPTGISGVSTLSCAAPGECAAAGSTLNGLDSEIFLTSESGGVWRTAQGLSGTSNNVAGAPNVADVSCPAAGECMAVGTQPIPQNSKAFAAVLTHDAVVESVTPSAGPTSGGTTILVQGTNLLGATKVAVGAHNGTSITVLNTHQVKVHTPAGAGQVNVIVTTPTATSAPVTQDRYKYVPAPTVSSVAPGSGTHSGGTTVFIHGTNLTGATVVLFGTKHAVSVTVVSSTEIKCRTPSGTGAVTVKVTTVGGTSVVTTGSHFHYT